MTFPIVAAGQRITPAMLNRYAAAGNATQTTVTAASLSDLCDTYFKAAAGEMQVGSGYRLTCYGTGAQGTTAQTLQVGWALNGTLGTSFTMASSFMPVSAAFRWRAVVEVVCLATSGAGSVQGCVSFDFSHGAPVTNWGSAVDQGNLAVNTTVTQTITLQAAWGATTGGPTITCLGTLAEKMTPGG